MGRRNHWNARHHSHQHAKGMTSTHVRVDQVDLVVPDPVGDPPELKRISIELGFDDLDRWVDVLLNPTFRSAENGDLMPK